jgi:hypothetical protein
VKQLALLALTGCAQLFGLEETTFDQRDAPTDAPSVCDFAPACTSSVGRSVCGQLFGVGATAGVPLRVASPTGEACVSGNTEGPCALAVQGMTKAELFAGGPDRVAGTIDDCGRYVVPDLDLAEPDVAVLFTGTDFRASASLVLGRPAQAGQDRDVAAFAVSIAATDAWASQLQLASDQTSTGYLVEYTMAGMPLAGEKVAVDNGSPFTGEVGTVPWAAYFAGDQRFGTLDRFLEATEQTGTALAVLDTGIFSLDGFRQGRRCRILDLQQVAGTLIYVRQIDC